MGCEFTRDSVIFRKRTLKGEHSKLVILKKYIYIYFDLWCLLSKGKREGSRAAGKKRMALKTPRRQGMT